MICLPYITSFMYWDWHYFLVPLTNWSLITTTVWLVYGIFAASSLEVSRHYFGDLEKTKQADFATAAMLQAIHHLLYTFSLICNVVVMIVYWSMLHGEQMAIHSGDPDVGTGRCYHLIIVHSLPGLVCFTNAYITQCLLKTSFYKIITMVAVIYGTFVFMFWKITGRIQYSFLNFEKSTCEALLTILCINIMGTALYILLCQIDGRIKSELKAKLDAID